MSCNNWAVCLCVRAVKSSLSRGTSLFHGHGLGSELEQYKLQFAQARCTCAPQLRQQFANRLKYKIEHESEKDLANTYDPSPSHVSEKDVAVGGISTSLLARSMRRRSCFSTGSW